VSVLILVVDDEEDVELLFRQRFRRDLKSRSVRDGVRTVRVCSAFPRIPKAVLCAQAFSRGEAGIDAILRRIQASQGNGAEFALR
jgi:hypothetical protein